MSWFVSNEAEFFALSLSVCRIKFFRVRSFKRRLYPGQLCNIGLRTTQVILTVDLNGRSCGILAGLIPPRQNFYGI